MIKKYSVVKDILKLVAFFILLLFFVLVSYIDIIKRDYGLLVLSVTNFMLYFYLFVNVIISMRNRKQFIKSVENEEGIYMNGLVEVKCDTHTVFKNDDIKEYLSKRQRKQLEKLEYAIVDGRSKNGKRYNKYYVCNLDEPYAKDVIGVILQGEIAKK